MQIRDDTGMIRDSRAHSLLEIEKQDVPRHDFDGDRRFSCTERLFLFVSMFIFDSCRSQLFSGFGICTTPP